MRRHEDAGALTVSYSARNRTPAGGPSAIGVTRQSGIDADVPPAALVTVGIPFRNARETLGDAIRSVFAQTTQAWRLLLIDDGSDDGSVEIAERVVDSRVSVVRRAASGLSDTLNEITLSAATPFIARMDADDLMFPTRLEVQLSELLQSPSIVVSCTACVSFANQTIYGVRGSALPTSRDVVLSRFGGIVHPTVMFKREWALSHPYERAFDGAEDWWLWLHAYDPQLFSCIASPQLFYRERLDFRKYRRSAHARDRILSQLSQGSLDWRMSRLRASNAAKTLVVGIASLVGRTDVVVRRRSRPVAPHEASTYLHLLSEIQRTPVPGLSLGKRP